MKQGWEYKKLGEVCYPKNKIQRATKCFDAFDKILYIDISSIDNTIQKMTDITSFIFSEAPSRAQQKVEYGDIIVSTVRPNLKNIAIIDRYESNLVASSGFCILRNTEYIERNFLFHYITSDLFTQHLMKLTTGANYPAVRDQDVRDSIIPLPPKPIQLAIVSELDKINELIRLKKEQLKDYDNLAQSIFYEMFGDPVENEMGWEVKKLEEVCNITSSKRIFADEYTDKGIPFYRSKEVIERSKGLPISVELFISPERYSEIKEKFGIPVVGDILITAVGTIGKIWSIDTDEKFYFKDGNLVWLKDIDTSLINTIFFRRLLEYLIDEYKKINANGAAYSALTIAKIKLMQCPLPPLPLQQLFAQRIEQIERQKAEVQKTITDLETLLASRMQHGHS